MSNRSYHKTPAQYKTSGFTRTMRNPEYWEGRTLPADLDWTPFHMSHNFCDNCHKFHKFDDLHNPIYPTNAYAWWMQEQIGTEEAEGYCEACYEEFASKAESIDADWHNKVIDGGKIPAAPLVNIVTRNGYEFAIEFFNDFYNLITLVGSDLPAKTAARTSAAINAAINALLEEMHPDPTPPAAPASIAVRADVRIYAVSNSRSENKVNIRPANSGAIYNCHGTEQELRYWLNYHAKKFGAPARIRMNVNSFVDLTEIDGITIERSKAVLTGYAWISCDDTIASAA